MSDPLSIAASAAGLISLGLQTTEYLYNYYTTYRDRDQDLARTADKLGDLVSTIKTIDEVVRTRKWRPDEQTVLWNVEKSIDRCGDVIHELQDEAQKFKKEPKDDWKKKIAAAGRRAAYPFRRSTLEKLDEDVDDFRDNLSLALQALQLKDHQNTLTDLEEVKKVVKNAQAQNVSASVRQWLNAADATIDLNIASAQRHPGTGQWLIQSPTFTTWLQDNNSFLWLYGFAGCGKSVLCSTAIQYTFRHQRTLNDCAVAFFFFTFRDESKQDASAALRALLLQLCGQVTGVEADLTHLQKSYNNGTPPIPVLLEHLRRTITQTRHVYILLDALDESPGETSRADVLSMIETMRQWRLPGLHLLVTSRDVPDIRDHMQFAHLSQEAQHIVLKNNSVQQDILQYVSYQVDHDPQLRRWGDHREKIKNYLAQHAGGVFRWVELQLGPLRQCARSEKHLEKCLHTLPPTLDETYERMLCNIGDESREEAQQLLSLLCYSHRPLSVDEVIDAIAVDVDILECYDHSSKLTGAEDLLRVCPGLIEIGFRHRMIDSYGHSDSDEEYDRDQGYDSCEDEDFVEERGEHYKYATGINTVRIAHFSVQEYLLSDRIGKSRAADFALLGPTQHGRTSKICLLYLNNDEFVSQTLTEDLVERYPLATYAARNWLYHYQKADDRLVEQLSPNIIELLSAKHIFDHWIRLYRPEFPSRDIRYNLIEDRPLPIYYAALLGLEGCLADLLSKSPNDVNTPGGWFGNALQAASSSGHAEVVKLLLEKGADVNAQGGKLDSALQAAAFNNRKRVVHILLENGADVEGPVMGFNSPLTLASREGHEEVVQLLLESGANVHALGGRWGNPLQTASKFGHGEIVQILLESGADVNAPGGPWGNALQAALRNRHEVVVQVLLAHGAAIDAQNESVGDPLQAASYHGEKEIVRALLLNGANVNAPAGPWGNALQLASKRGHEEVVQLLLDNGADVNAPGHALRAATRFGHGKILEMLLKWGADINALAGIWGTALHLASRNGDTEMLQILLDNGAEIHAPSELGDTLQTASYCGRTDIVQMLLWNGASINAPPGPYGSALQAASRQGQVEVVQMLLENGAGSNNEEVNSAIQAALDRGHVKTVQMLLKWGEKG